jgi:phospholipid/cholesterol/gamma-HCH transport system permease protein
MQVTRELDALRVLGLPPSEFVVLPRLLALVLTLPLLTVIADVSAIAGGMFLVSLSTDITTSSFVGRIPDAVSLDSFLVGVGKTPVFAALIGIVSSWQGLEARQDASSVGYRTTMSVVQSIFLIIVADAVFSVVFTLFDI